MPQYIFLMHEDSAQEEQAWEPYLAALQERGLFQGAAPLAMESARARAIHPLRCRLD